MQQYNIRNLKRLDSDLASLEDDAAALVKGAVSSRRMSRGVLSSLAQSLHGGLIGVRERVTNMLRYTDDLPVPPVTKVTLDALLAKMDEVRTMVACGNKPIDRSGLLVIDNVDHDNLESQRELLNHVLDTINDCRVVRTVPAKSRDVASVPLERLRYQVELTMGERDALVSLGAMLDSWSDEKWSEGRSTMLQAGKILDDNVAKAQEDDV